MSKNSHYRQNKDRLLFIYLFILSINNLMRNQPRKGMKRRWSIGYKRSIDCSNPRGFSQKNYCKRQRRGGKYMEGFKTWLENNEKKILILVHPDCVTEVSESAANEYDALLRNHLGRFDYVITHLFYSKNYTDWMQKDSSERYSQIQKIRETVRSFSHEVIEAENERCSYNQNIPDYLIDNPGVTVYMAGGYEDNCLWTSYIRLFRGLHDVLREGNHMVYWYRPLIFQDMGHGLQGTKKYPTLDPEEIQMDRERPELVPDRGALRFHPDKVNYKENNQLLSWSGVGSDNLGYAESSNAVDPEMLGELFNRDPYELVSFLREKLRENSSLRFNIVADWVDVNTARGAKAILDSWGSRLNIDSFTVRATHEQYMQDPNAFESGVRWERVG